MKLTYKKGGTMGGCYKCGGKMHAAKGMKMGACYKCGGKMYGQKGMVFDEDPPVEPKITLPYNPLAPQTLSSDNTKNKIQITPTGSELAYSNAMANRPVITATKPKTQPKPEQKRQESMLAPLVAEERSKMVGNLFGTPASGAVNSLGVIGENYLAENPEVAAGILATIYGGPAAGLYTKGLLSGGKALAKQAFKRGLRGLNAYGATNLITQGLPALAATIPLTASAPIETYNKNSPIQTFERAPNITSQRDLPVDETSKLFTIGGISGLLSLTSNPYLRGLGWLGNTYVGGKSLYNFANSGSMYDLAPIFFPTIGRAAGKVGVLGAQKLNRIFSGNKKYDYIADPTKKLIGRDIPGKKVNFVYDKKTGSFGYKGDDLWGTGSPLRGFSWSNTFPSMYAITGGKNYLPNINPFSKFSKRNLGLDMAINKKLSSIGQNITKKELDNATDYVNKALELRYGKNTNLKFSDLFNTQTGAMRYSPKGPLSQKIAYGFATSPVSSTLKTLALAGGATAVANTELGLNIGQKSKNLFKYLREGDGIQSIPEHWKQKSSFYNKPKKKIRAVNPNRL